MNRLGIMTRALALTLAGAASAAAEDGSALFVSNCQTCHIIAREGPKRMGPPLGGVLGRPAGTVEGFPYSAGLKASGIIWTEDKLDQWLTFPRKMVRDTTMVYRQANPEIRKAIIDYIANHKD